MEATVNKLLTIVRADLGYTESPKGSNKTKYGEWFGQNGQPWCMMSAQYWYAKAGIKLPVRTASCGAMMRAAQAAGCWVTKDFAPGDLVIYDFPGGAETDHCGIIEHVYSSKIVALEGNTGSDSDANGGQVQERDRLYKYVKGAVRQTFEEEEEIVTYDQWKAFKEQYDKEQAALAPSDTKVSEDARTWAEDKGLITGYSDGSKRYKAYATREQLVILLKRFAEMIGKA